MGMTELMLYGVYQERKRAEAYNVTMNESYTNIERRVKKVKRASYRIYLLLTLYTLVIILGMWLSRDAGHHYHRIQL